jgi:hypothetical protein
MAFLETSKPAITKSARIVTGAAIIIHNGVRYWQSLEFLLAIQFKISNSIACDKAARLPEPIFLVDGFTALRIRFSLR